MQICIIGIGNQWASDDGVGPLVIQALREKTLRPVGHQIRLVTLRFAGPELLNLMDNCGLMLLVDAVFGEGQPGSIYCDEWQPGLLAGRGVERISGHGLGLNDVLALAAVLKKLPPRVVLWGIEVASTRSTNGLSPAVAEAVPVLVEKICRQVEQLAGPLINQKG